MDQERRDREKGSFERMGENLGWGDASRESHGEWPEVRGFVGFGYSQENPDTLRDV